MAGVFAYLGCSDGDGPTAPTFEVAPPSAAPAAVNTTNANPPPADNGSEDDESEGPINAAEGKLVIRGNFGACEQKTNWPIDRMSIFRVLDGGAQTRIELYGNPPEGNIPCGVLIQIDCTVREPDPDARPGAHNLYASWGSDGGRILECRTPVCVNCGPKKCTEDDVPLPEDDDSRERECVFDSEKCEWNCTPCSFEEIGREVTFEGECDGREKVTTVKLQNTCTGEIIKNVHREPAPEECPEPCDLDFEARGRRCENAGGTYTFDRELCTDNCDIPPPCEPGEEEITDVVVFFEGECEERVEVTITVWTDICTQQSRRERTEEPAPEHCACEPEGENPGQSCDADGGGTICRWDDNPEICGWICVPDETCEPPGDCIYEYGGPPADKEALCLALSDSAFWSDGSQHCVIPLPGIAADSWNLNPGQSHPECLRKQDQD